MKLRIRVYLLTAIAGTAFLTSPLPTLAERDAPNAEVPMPRKAKFDAIQARAQTAVARLDFKNPEAVKMANAELAKVHADFVAYAKANGFKISRKEHTKPAKGGQSCDKVQGCVLKSANVDGDGVLHCQYTCLPAYNIFGLMARADAAASKLASRDPNVVKQAQTELSSVHVALVKYAKKNRLELTTYQAKNPLNSLGQSCPGTKLIPGKICTLTSSSSQGGALTCEYDCVALPKKR